MRVNVDGIDRTVHVVDADARWIRHGRDTVCVTPWDPTPAPTVAAGNAETRAPSAGRVLWLAEVDSVVTVGDRVAVIEAMKLETTLRATVSGVVREVRATVGTNVSAGCVLVVLHEVS
jgi:3-methylcrotonyl-CoA carboxylase alpha subunit